MRPRVSLLFPRAVLARGISPGDHGVLLPGCCGSAPEPLRVDLNLHLNVTQSVFSLGVCGLSMQALSFKVKCELGSQGMKFMSKNGGFFLVVVFVSPTSGLLCTNAPAAWMASSARRVFHASFPPGSPEQAAPQRGRNPFCWVLFSLSFFREGKKIKSIK